MTPVDIGRADETGDPAFVPRLPGASREAQLHDQLYRYAEDLEHVIEQLDQLRRQNQELRNSQSLSHDQISVLEELLLGSHQMHLVTDADGRIERANAAAGLAGQLPGTLLRDLVVESGRPAFDRLLQQANTGTATEEIEVLFDDGRGGRRILGLRATADRADGRVAGVHWLARDLTRARENEFDSQVAALVLDNANEAVMITDVDGGILSVNPAFTAITGYHLDEVRGKTPRCLKSGFQNASFYESFWAALREQGRWQGELVNRRKNGEAYAEWLTVTAVRDPDGHLLSYIGVFSDLSKVREAENRLAHLAYYDSLTDLPNRLLFDDRVSQAVSAARRFGNTFALLYIDLDHFKQINDSRGHAAGDQVLREAARRLQSSCRDVDTAARLGGDEFAILMPGLADPADIERFCLRLIDALGIPIDCGGERFEIGASVGVARFPTDADEQDLLIKRADAAMYRAKRSGGNLHALWSDQADAPVAGQPRIEHEIAHAVARGELSLVYQPQITAGPERRTFAVEALLRWTHPHFGELMPADFIPVAERTGAIIGIGRWVLETACGQLRRWWDAGHAPLTLAVNVSPRQLRQPDFVDLLQRILDSSGIPPGALEIEITESEAMLQSEGAIGGRRATGTLARLREIGVRIAIDDFGTGFSSLGRLRSLPIDRIKIDRSFVADLERDVDAQALSTCIIAMGRALGLPVTAEGVETEAQVAILARQGCSQHQGFVYSRPLPPAQLSEWLRDCAVADWAPVHVIGRSK